MMHIAAGVFVGIVSAVWCLNWMAARQRARDYRRGMQLLHPHLYPAKRKSHDKDGVGFVWMFSAITVGTIAAIVAHMP